MNLIDLKVTEFLNEVDSDRPAPGGGSVSALASSLGVGLSRMVSHLTVNKKKYLELDELVRNQYEENFTMLNQIKEELIPLIDKDTLAFNQIMDAFKLPKVTEEEKQKRNEAIEVATLAAIRVPYDVARLSLKALEHVEKMMLYGNKNAISDIGVGSLLLFAGLEGALLNVKINMSGISDIDQIKMYQNSCDIILREGNESKVRILQFVYSQL